MKVTLILLTFFCGIQLFAQPFEKIYDMGCQQSPRSLCEFAGNYYVSSMNYNSDDEDVKAVIYKFDIDGNLLKTFTLNDSSENVISRLIPIGDSVIVCIGHQKNLQDTGLNIFFLQLDKNLDLLKRTDNYFKVPQSDYYNTSYCINRQGNIVFHLIFFCYFNHKNKPGNILMEYSPNGDLINSMSYIDLEHLYTSRSAITAELKTDGYLLFGVYGMFHITKELEYNDTIVLHNHFGPTYDLIADVIIESDSTYVATIPYNADEYDYYMGICRISKDLKLINDKRYDHVSSTDMYPYYQSFDTCRGYYYMAVSNQISSGEFIEYYNSTKIVKARNDFSVVWDTTMGFDAYYGIRCIIGTSDGGCLLAGRRYDRNIAPKQFNLYLLKLDSLGNKTSSVIDEGQMNATGVSIYPNPGSTAIHVNISENDKGNFRLYNLNGQLVFNQNITAKNNTIHLPELQPGIYIYEFVGQNGETTRGKWICE